MLLLLLHCTFFAAGQWSPVEGCCKSYTNPVQPWTLITLSSKLLTRSPSPLLLLLLLLLATLSAAGQWSPVEGYCEPYTNPDCSNGYPNIPDPPGTSGWTCYSTGYGYYSQRICSAACLPGFYAHPCEPTVTCAGDGTWTQVRGACIPYREPSKRECLLLLVLLLLSWCSCLVCSGVGVWTATGSVSHTGSRQSVSACCCCCCRSCGWACCSRAS
jgi:hypothetical protein